jgi:predicted SprT family Zn-dependent metalloprotease
MELTEVQELAIGLMREHELDGWTLRFDRARDRAGICRRGKREISLSGPLMSLWTEDQIRDTVLHEIAHALAPAKAGHGRAWQLICLQIGANPSRNWGDGGEQRIAKRYIGTCPNGHEIHRDRRPTGAASCTQCSRSRRFNPSYTFTWRTA